MSRLKRGGHGHWGCDIPVMIAKLLRHMLYGALRSERDDQTDRDRLLAAMDGDLGDATAEELAIQALVPVERTWRLLEHAKAGGIVTSETRAGRVVWLRAHKRR